MKSLLLAVMILITPLTVNAEEFITVNDMSQVKWQMAPNGRVYFRNMDSFNASALPCCYSYFIDTSTDVGKSVWSVVLTKMATSSKLILGVPSLSSGGEITYLGLW